MRQSYDYTRIYANIMHIFVHLAVFYAQVGILIYLE